MAIKTMASNSGGKWTLGWHTLSISKAEYGNWNDKRYLEVWFDGYPDNFSLRTYEAHNKETQEEFAISKFFKLANAGIIDIIKSANGKEAIQYDDDESGLIGKHINTFFYENKEGFKRISDRIAPVEQKGEVFSYSNDDVKYWKGASEKHYNEYLKADAPASSGLSTAASSTEEEENIPF